MAGVKLKEQYISYLSFLHTLNNVSVIMLLHTFNNISLISNMCKGNFVIPVSCVYGPFHVCMARFKCARAVQRCTIRSKVHAQFLNTSSTCYVTLVVSAVTFPRNLHYFDVTSSHNFRRNFQ